MKQFDCDAWHYATQCAVCSLHIPIMPQPHYWHWDACKWLKDDERHIQNCEWQSHPSMPDASTQIVCKVFKCISEGPCACVCVRVWGTGWCVGSMLTVTQSSSLSCSLLIFVGQSIRIRHTNRLSELSVCTFSIYLQQKQKPNSCVQISMYTYVCMYVCVWVCVHKV